MRQLQQLFTKEMLRSTKVVGLVLGVGGLVFLGGVCTWWPETNINSVGLDTNEVTNSSVADVVMNSNEDTNSPEIDTTDWLTYTNEEYGFSFRYPGDWNLNENASTVSLSSPELLDSTYVNSVVLSVTKNDFETQKKEIENSDIIQENISLSKFNNDIQKLNLNKLIAIVGTHSTAIGVDEKYYYISLPDGSAVYFEFIKPTSRMNFLIDDMIKTFEVK